MKKLLLLLLISPLFLACSDDDEEQVEYSETVGYLTNLTSVEYALFNTLWAHPSTGELLKFDRMGFFVVGYTSVMVEGYFELLRDGDAYFLRVFAADDEERTGSYVEYTITLLDKVQLHFSSSDEAFEYVVKAR